MKQGAFDFIGRPFEDKFLIKTINAALGSACVGVPDPEAIEAARRLTTLSQRERQVLDALVRGLPNKPIAVELGLSVRTVEVHRAHMLHRLGVHRVEIRLAHITLQHALARNSPRRRDSPRAQNWFSRRYGESP